MQQKQKGIWYIMRYPNHLEIETSSFCQLKCIFCPHKDMKRKQGNMTLALLEKIIDESRGKTKTCHLHQIGEPLFNDDLPHMIHYTKNADIHTSISTNAMMLNELWIERLTNCEPDEITLCLDAFNKEQYNKYRVGGDWEKVNKNILNYLEVYKDLKKEAHIIIQLIKMDQDDGDILGFIEYWSKLLGNRGTVNIKQYSTFGGYVKDIPGDTPPRRHGCKYPWTHTAIHWNGDMCICCRDYEGITKVGNINDNSISELYNSLKYEVYRDEFGTKSFYNDLCKNC